MPNSKTYNLEYFSRGDDYSASSDYRRFFTVDYNMESFVGIMGVGIINGWTIQHVSGLTVSILPGTGLINGYFIESPYTVKQRSTMIMGDREIEIIRVDDVPEAYLSPAQKTTYVSIIQAYNPTYVPPAFVENAYVKVVVPYTMVLDNNIDNYVYVELKYSSYYPPSNTSSAIPPMNSYPTVDYDAPSVYDYPNYDDYLTAKATYDAQKLALTNYRWRNYATNRFTEADFKKSTSTYMTSSSKILLGKVTTRSGTVDSIDTSDVDSLANMESAITKYANNVLENHVHGGSQEYDPPKIHLETDIRKAVFISYDSNSKNATYQVLEKTYTDISSGHQHTYYIDSVGNGLTVHQIGSGNNHFHKIISFIVQTQEGSAIENHTHTISSTADTSWTSTSEFVVYINKVIAGDETTASITVDTDAKRIVMNGIIGGLYKTYSSSFTAYGKPYAFSLETNSIYRFMYYMNQDFNEKFESDLSSEDAYASHPFIFVNDDGALAGFGDLQNQSLAAEAFLKEEGDTFTFTPDAARNITVTLSSYKKILGVESYDVEIEILGTSEVTGVINTDRIAYVNASKIASGEFEVARIPFISHIGKLKEEINPYQYPLSSDNGVIYQTLPMTTSLNMDHYHNATLDVSNNGTTQYMYVDDKPSYYADYNGKTYLVNHVHNISDGTVATSGSSGLLEWQQAKGSTITSSDHTHTLSNYVHGDSRIVYSVFEDRFGNIFAGTSNGLIEIPYYPAYLFIINGYSVYETGIDLWEAFGKAAAQYEVLSEKQLKYPASTYYDQIIEAETELSSDDYSVLLENKIAGDKTADTIMIKRKTSFEIPNFATKNERESYELVDDEVIYEVKVKDTVGNEYDTSNTSVQSLITTAKGVGFKYVYETQKNLNITPMWGIDIRTVTENGIDYEKMIVYGSNCIAYNTDVSLSFYNDWSESGVPLFSLPYRKLIKDMEGNVWVATDNGILVSRYYNNTKFFDPVTRPGLVPEVSDIVEGDNNVIYCASGNYIYKTLNSGKTWVNLLDAGSKVLYLLHDVTADITDNLSGHTHIYQVDLNGDGSLPSTGTTHSHTVNRWVVGVTFGHTHTLVPTIYAICENRKVFISSDTGATWTTLDYLPDGDYSSVFAYSGKVYVAMSDSLYRLDNTWVNVFSKTVYSFSMSFDRVSMILGCDNSIYQTSDGDIYTLVYDFYGLPSPTILRNGNKQNFGYAFSNISGRFNFNNSLVSDDTISALVDFRKWLMDSPWETSSLYDLYIDKKLSLSTRGDISNPVVAEIYPSLGEINFGAQSLLTTAVDIYDDNIVVSDATKFASGDRILIISTASSGTTPTNPGLTNGKNTATYVSSYDTYSSNSISISNMYFYTTIDSISTNTITLTENCDKNIILPAMVCKIPEYNSYTTMNMSIYSGTLKDIGINTHEEVEDKLSYRSDFRPYDLNNSYLSNILQLTQAVRYIYPDINSYFKQTNFYDFNYSLNPLDPNYIDNYIDRMNSAIFNKGCFTDEFMAKRAKSVNAIVVGTGSFVNAIFAATDIGLFWAKVSPYMESNWFYIFDINCPVYDVVICNGTIALAATGNGIYSSTDGIVWTLQTAESIAFSSYAFSFRWPNKSPYIVPSHTAELSNYTDSNGNTFGVIKASTDLYTNAPNNRVLRVKITSDPSNTKNGFYTIKDVYPSQINLNIAFPGNTETVTGLVLEIASWWEMFSGQVNIGNTNLVNSLIVGGSNNISFNPDGTNVVWTSSNANIIHELQNYDVVDFCPMSNGQIIACAPGNNLQVLKNYILGCYDNGTTWNIEKELDEIKGTILLSDTTVFNHSILKVSYTNMSNYTDGNMDKHRISLFVNDARVYSGYVIWNRRLDNLDYIYIFENYANTIVRDNIDEGKTVTFIIYPSTPNIASESSSGTVFFGTSTGLYYDNNTLTTNDVIDGAILIKGTTGTVSQIDQTGIIKSTSVNSANDHVILTISFDSNVVKNELSGKSLYITDNNPVSKYDIVSNTTRLSTGQAEVELSVESDDTWQFNVDKRITAVGISSRIFVDYDAVVLADQYKNGKIYITSNENNNEGNSYSIVSNRDNYIDVTPFIVPSSTLSFDSNNNIIKGQKIMLVYSDNIIDITTSFNRDVDVNEFAGMSLSIIHDGISYEDLPIISNTKSHIVFKCDLEDFYDSIDISSSFRVEGFNYQDVPNFDDRNTSIQLDHYHDTQMVNKIVSGEIATIVSTNGDIATFSVSNTSGFSDAIVQQRGDLFQDASIRYYNPLNNEVEFFGEVVSHTASTITVKVLSTNSWDFIAYSDIEISVGWYWEINAYHYGYTNNTYYHDFASIHTDVSQDINVGDTAIYVTSTVGFNDGDKIRFEQDGTTSEINYIDHVIDATTFVTSDSCKLPFTLLKRATVKVLVDEFSNTHEHQIRSNSVEPIAVSDYLDRGYPSSHSHRVLPLLENVADILIEDDDIIVAGSSPTIYRSSDNGNNWTRIADLNTFVENNSDIDAVSSLTLFNGLIIAGTINGEVFVEEESGGPILALEQPSVV